MISLLSCNIFPFESLIGFLTVFFFLTLLFTSQIFDPVLEFVSATFLLVCFLSLKSTCKTWQHVFYFTSKALFLVKKITF